MRPRKHFDWATMQAFIDAGNGYLRCTKRFGIAHATWMKAIAAGDLRVDLDGKSYRAARKRYDWNVVQAFYDAGNSMRACQRHFGFSSLTWQKARKRGQIAIRSARVFTIEELAVKRSNRKNIKRRFLASGHLENRCALCGLEEWQGKPLTLQIDHINGQRLDYRLENLRILCPNCHSQTDTFAGRNLVARRRSPG